MNSSANKVSTRIDEVLSTSQILLSLPPQGGRGTDTAFAVREVFKDYFSSPVGRIVPLDINV